MSRYLIPKPITQKYELLPGTGWGLVEAGLVGGGLAGGLGLLVLSRLTPWPLPVRLGLAVLVAAVGMALAFPVPGQEPLHRLLRAWWRYRHRPRLYLYDWTARDGANGPPAPD